MNFRKIFLLSFLLVSLQANAVVQQRHPELVSGSNSVKIFKILNTSSEKAVFINGIRETEIKSLGDKKMFTTIPYNDVQKNLIDFVQDRPYIAENTLKLVTSEGTFHIWCDHRGVIVAKVFERGMSRNEAIPKSFLSLSQADLATIVGCLVTIDQSGSLSIQKI